MAVFLLQGGPSSGRQILGGLIRGERVRTREAGERGEAAGRQGSRKRRKEVRLRGGTAGLDARAATPERVAV